MKKIIAFAMSALLAVSAVALPVTAEPAAPFLNEIVDIEWAQARPVSAQELAQVRSKTADAQTDPTEATADEKNAGCITDLPVTETASIHAEGAVQSQESSQIPLPVVAHVTASTIVFEKVDGYEYYVIGGHLVYQHASNVFTNLSPNTVYECRLKTPGNSGVRGEAVFITTKDRAPCSTVPKAPMVAEYTSHNINLVRREGYEYRMNDGNWSDSYIFTGLEPDTEYTFYQRIKQTNAEMASESSEPLRCKTAFVGPHSETNMNLLLKHIKDNDNSFVNEDGNKSLAYKITDENGTEYYFLMTNCEFHVQFEVFSYTEEANCLLFDTAFNLGPYDTLVQLDFGASLYSNNDCVDYVSDFSNLPLDTYHIGDPLTVTEAGVYLSAEDLSPLCTLTTQMLFSFWDEYIYGTLGFGFRGLGFVVTEGYGDLYCHTPLEAHFGDTVIVSQREAECLVDGCDGVPYCSLCGFRITDYYGTTSRGYHVYDNDCDTDCNDCGELRGVPHIYSFACDTECDICGAVRPDPLAMHKPGENQLCTVCGEKSGLLGDATGDGKVNMGDVSAVYAHVRGTTLLTDSVLLAVADVSGDGNINMGDISMIIAHVRGTTSLW